MSVVNALQDTGYDLNQLLESVPRVSLAHLPTPLEFLPRLTAHFGGPDIYVKRDDCTGLGTGGNKTRKLEFVMAEATEQGATTVITNGAVQSNHARQTAAAAAKLGMKCELMFEHRVPQPSSDYLHSGNVFLDELFGARTWNCPRGADMNAEMEQLAGRLKDEGEKPYIIVGGASCPLGALGYVGCAAEIIEQSKQLGIELGQVVHATGSAGTQAGLVVGLKAAGSGIPVLGIGVNAPVDVQEERVFKLACETAASLDPGIVIERKDVVANCNYVGDGYGLVTDGMIEAVRLVAELEGLLFDPVYSGKGLAGLFDLMRKGHFDDDSALVFVHTGGSAALFAYRQQMAAPGS
ncbi:MAG: D-cysteine desulfhydrase [Lysobacterales bacterium]|jgi:L-cysteate sulfo-lyase